MSVDAKAVAMYGVYLEDRHEVTKFLKTYNVEELEDLDTKAELCCLNAYSGDPYILGYHMDLKTPIEKYMALWEKDFPSSPVKPDAHLEVSWR